MNQAGIDSILQYSLPGRSGDWSGDATFAHPAEREVARMFDLFGLRWSYEPTSFTLRRDDDGRVAEMMTPDFYLPDLDVYVELTTMRQSLVTRKNRKARLLRERYPDVKLKMLYRADYLRLLEYYRRALSQSHHNFSSDVFLSSEHIKAAVSVIATRVLARCERLRLLTGEVSMLVIGGRGSRPLLEDCLNRLHACGVQPPFCEIRFAVSGARGRMTTVGSRNPPLAGQHVILLETLVSTGMHLAHVQRWLRNRGTTILDTAALCARPGSRTMGCTLDHVGFEAPNRLMAGYGLQIRSEMGSLRQIVTVLTPTYDPVAALLSEPWAQT
ncbi:MAG: hypothetical protein M3440_09180 [Chloroflexota bacterium]|nr:hypothetical protein [Chloroflexota bacterium]